MVSAASAESFFKSSDHPFEFPGGQQTHSALFFLMFSFSSQILWHVNREREREERKRERESESESERESARARERESERARARRERERERERDR
jgi:hypothetical protein